MTSFIISLTQIMHSKLWRWCFEGNQTSHLKNILDGEVNWLVYVVAFVHVVHLIWFACNQPLPGCEGLTIHRSRYVLNFHML